MKVIRDIDKNIFRAYDIRGVYGKNVTEDVAYTIGKAFGTYIKRFDENMCLVGHDNRLSSNSLNEALVDGILSTGIDVIDLGLVTTPMYYYARLLKQIKPAVMITASHNPKEDNGFKLSFEKIAKGEDIYSFRDYVINNAFDEGHGTLYRYNMKSEYFDLFKKTLNFGDKRLKVVLDCGNGTTSIIARELYSMFPIDIVMLYDESDGSFPNHHPDPTVEQNLTDLKKKVIEEKADLGIGFDGDGDRAGFVDSKGNVISSSKYAVIVLQNLLKNTKNKKVLYDIKTSNIVKEEVERNDGISIEYRTGAQYVINKIIDDNILFGVEYSGHIYFNNEFPVINSGLYAGLKLIEILSKTDKTTNDLLKDITKYYEIPEIKIKSTDEKKVEVVNAIKSYAISKNYKINDIDGVKIYYEDGWALVRYSNTGPNITMRFESKTEKRLEEMQKEFDILIKEYNE